MGGTRSLHPSHTVDTGTIDERREDELASVAALVLRGRCEDGDNWRGHPKRMQHAVEVFGNAHGQDYKRIRGLRRTLGKKNLSINSNCLVRVGEFTRDG